MKVKKYIAVSDFVRNRLQISHHVSPEKTVTIYNGVNVARFTPCNQVMARKIAGLPMDRKIILSVAMLIPEQGIQHLIHAAHILVYEYHMLDLCIVIAGEGPFREELNVLVNTLQLSEFVLFLGSRNDVDILVGAADVVAVPAIWAESFGLIIAEAMAGGRPVVASRIGGITELIKGGTNGLLVEPGDQRGLAEAILHMLNNVAYREQIVSAALSEVRERFDLSRQVAQLVDLYDTLREVVRD
jgi:glycosyltransferase involved in cell wall biosynthesis